MAVSKILCMKDSGRGFPGRHLKAAIEYILDETKTDNGRYIGAVNCQTDFAYEQMVQTKKLFHKTDKRQGYHIIISFKEGEVNSNIAYDIIQKFVEDYLGEAYEAVYSVHSNTEHIHGHIVFNSVSFVDGKKYRYEKGDWAKTIQPQINKLCEEYGLSTIDVSQDGRGNNKRYTDWNEFRDGRFVWSDMIKRDIDSCIIQSPTFDEFLLMLRDKGYEIKQGKYLALKPKGMTRYKRCKTLGEDYSEDRIKERILSESLMEMKDKSRIRPKVVACYFKRYRRKKLTGLQKKYFAKLYRTGKLKKRPYSQAWKYKDDIRKMHLLQEQYRFLSRYDIYDNEKLLGVADDINVRRKTLSSKKSKVYKEKQKFIPLFEILKKADGLAEAEEAFQNGDMFFEDEHKQWEELISMVKEQGYSIEEVRKLREHYFQKYDEIRQQEKELRHEQKIAQSIIDDYTHESEIKIPQKEQKTEKKDLRQPTR